MNQAISLKELVLLGYIKHACGLSGILAYSLFNKQNKALQCNLKVTLVKTKASFYKISQILPNNKIKFKGINDRTTAMLIANSQIWIQKKNLPEVGFDEIYLADLIDFDVKNLEHKKIGKITGFSDNKYQAVLEVNSKTLIPFVPQIILNINKDRKQITTNWHHVG